MNRFTRLGLALTVFTITGQTFAQKAITHSSFATTEQSTGSRFQVTGSVGQSSASMVRLAGTKFSVDGGFHRLIVVVQTSGAPSLSLNRAGGDITITWPSEITGWILQQSERVGPGANWQDTTGVSNNSITAPIPTGTRFYRLRRP